jgi:EthD domain
MNRADFSGRDEAGTVAFYVLLWKRKGLSLQLFDDYWRDVHGPVCARLPGQHQYWQFHVAHNEGGIWPTLAGIEYITAAEDQLNSIAELTFKTVEDRNIWFQSAALLMDDEHNIFSQAIGYITNPGNSKTYIDRITKGNPNGSLDAVKLHVLVKKQDSVSVAEFRQFLSDRFAPIITKSDFLLKFRLHLFEEVDNSRPEAKGVAHSESPERHYQAAFEIAFANNLDLEYFFASAEYASTLAEQPRYIKQIGTFPERDPYTFVYDSKLTLAGQRGSSTAQLITKIGAVNQLTEEVLNLILGKVVR